MTRWEGMTSVTHTCIYNFCRCFKANALLKMTLNELQTLRLDPGQAEKAMNVIDTFKSGGKVCNASILHALAYEHLISLL